VVSALTLSPPLGAEHDGDAHQDRVRERVDRGRRSYRSCSLSGVPLGMRPLSPGFAPGFAVVDAGFAEAVVAGLGVAAGFAAAVVDGLAAGLSVLVEDGVALAAEPASGAAAAGAPDCGASSVLAAPPGPICGPVEVCPPSSSPPLSFGASMPGRAA